MNMKIKRYGVNRNHTQTVIKTGNLKIKKTPQGLQ